MYIVIFGRRDGYFGPFETQADGLNYIDYCETEGVVIALVKPYSLGKAATHQVGG